MEVENKCNYKFVHIEIGLKNIFKLLEFMI